MLLAEIHIAFLKLALKNDEEEQVTLSVQDTNNSFNIIVQLIEPMTYAEVGIFQSFFFRMAFKCCEDPRQQLFIHFLFIFDIVIGFKLVL